VDGMLPKIEHLIIKMVDKYPDEITENYIIGKIISGHFIMLMLIDNEEIVDLLLAHINECPTGLRLLEIPIQAGKGVIEYAKPVNQGVMDFAKAMDCSQVRGQSVRPGMVPILKNFGWKIHHPEMMIEV